MPARLVAVAFVLLTFLPVRAEAATPTLPDRIAAAWTKDRVYVDERLAPAMPATELSRIRTAASTAGFPVYVALVPRTPDLLPILYDLPTLLQARTGQPGLYIIQTVTDEYWSGVEELYRPGNLAGRSLISVESDDKQRLDIVNDRPAPHVVRTIQQAGTAYDGRALPAVPAGDLEPERSERGMSVTDKENRAAYIGLAGGGLAGFVLTLWLALRRKRRKQDPKGPFGRPSVGLASTKTKADAQLRRADQAVERLSKRAKLSAHQLDERDDATRRLDAAHTLRERHPDDLLSMVGALVLARQAERVAAGSPVQPPCFFDPTHQPGTTTVTWDDDVEVPTCRNCAAVFAKGRRPLGLRVQRKSGRRGHEIVPYWTLDPEDSPMVATGFGALSDDLPERISGRLDDVR
ncbi:hypothetical protein AB0L70_01360 [Kribbella sp. NPDC051952]|uniref:hypothetical protein n=1 Tax=Kribbella sp. NPDC051952 TaxID=3154851 RepID=UPI00343CABA3